MSSNASKEALGLLQLYIGNGKGKTTAAVGQAVRAHGHGLRVLFVQFLKGRQSGESGALSLLGIEIRQVQDSEKFLFSMSEEEKEHQKQRTQHALETLAGEISTGQYDLVVLDEILDACSLSLAGYETLYDLVARTKENHCELIFTGRGVPMKLYELADYISEILPIKHPYDKGITAREGIEY